MVWFVLFTLVGWAETGADDCGETFLYQSVPAPNAENVPLNPKLFTYLFDAGCGSSIFAATLTGPSGVMFETSVRASSFEVGELGLDTALEPNADYELVLVGVEAGERFSIPFRTGDESIGEWTNPELTLNSAIVTEVAPGAHGEVQADVSFGVAGSFVALRQVIGGERDHQIRPRTDEDLPRTESFRLDANAEFCLNASEYSYAGIEESGVVCIQDPAIGELDDDPGIDDDGNVGDDNSTGCTTMPVVSATGLLVLPMLLLGFRRRDGVTGRPTARSASQTMPARAQPLR